MAKVKSLSELLIACGGSFPQDGKLPEGVEICSFIDGEPIGDVRDAKVVSLLNERSHKVDHNVIVSKQDMQLLGDIRSHWLLAACKWNQERLNSVATLIDGAIQQAKAHGSFGKHDVNLIGGQLPGEAVRILIPSADDMTDAAVAEFSTRLLANEQVMNDQLRDMTREEEPKLYEMAEFAAQRLYGENGVIPKTERAFANGVKVLQLTVTVGSDRVYGLFAVSVAEIFAVNEHMRRAYPKGSNVFFTLMHLAPALLYAREVARVKKSKFKQKKTIGSWQGRLPETGEASEEEVAAYQARTARQNRWAAISNPRRVSKDARAEAENDG